MSTEPVPCGRQFVLEDVEQHPGAGLRALTERDGGLRRHLAGVGLAPQNPLMSETAAVAAAIASAAPIDGAGGLRLIIAARQKHQHNAAARMPPAAEST